MPFTLVACDFIVNLLRLIQLITSFFLPGKFLFNIIKKTCALGKMLYSIFGKETNFHIFEIQNVLKIVHIFQRIFDTLS